MPDRSFTYRVIIDTAGARAQAAQLRAVFEKQLSSIQTKSTQLIDPTSLRNVQQAIQQQTQAQQQAGRVALEQEKQVTQGARASAQERIQAVRAESAERAQMARAAAQRVIEEERRTTAQVKAEIAQQQAARATPGKGGSGNLTSKVLGGIALGAATIGVSRLTSELDQLGRRGAVFAQLKDVLDDYAASVGTTSKAMIDAAKKAAQGTISEYELILNANRAIQFEVAKTPEAFAKLIELSTALGRAQGISDTQALEFLTTGLARESKLILDNLGLIVNLSDATDKYAATLGKTSEQLTTSERKQALLEEAYRQGAVAIQANRDAAESAATQIEKFDANVQNLKDSFGQLIALSLASKIGEIATALAAVNTELSEKGTVEGKERDLERLIAMRDELSKDQAISIPGFGQINANAQSLKAVTQAIAETEQELLKLRSTSQLAGTSMQQAATLSLQAADAYGQYERQVAAANIKTVIFSGTLDELSNASNLLDNVQFSGIDGIKEWNEELAKLRSEFLQTGTLTEEQSTRLDFLSKAIAANISPSSELGQIVQELGTSFLQNNEAAAEYAQQIIDLTAAKANAIITDEQYAAGLEKITAGLQQAADSAQFSFNAALTKSTQAIAQLDQMIAAGTPGLTAWRDELTAIRDDIISTGSITEQQAFQVDALAVSISNAAAVQADYGAAVNELGNAFFATNDRAREIAEQLNQLSTAYTAGAINADTYAASANSLRNELDSIAFNESAISTTSLDSLSQAITALDLAAAGGVPGLDTLVDQALNLEAQLGTTGLVTAEQAAEIEYLSAVAAVASDSTGLLADINGALGESFLQNNEYASGLVERIILLIGAHESGAISSEVFAGALSVLTSQMVVTGEQAGLTAAQINAAFGELQAFSAAQSSVFGGTGGFVRGQRLAQSNVAAEQAKERQRVRIANERAAKESARAFKSAANEAQKAFEKAAKEFESALKNVPGLFGRSQVTEGQMKLAKAGVPQNFADDFLRRLEDEIKNGVDWPDVSIEQANEALKRVGVQVTDDANLTLQQLVDAWESGLLFSDKVNLELFNEEAVKAAIELQEKVKQGQENITNYFKEMIGMQIDAVTGTPIVGADGTTKAAAGANVPQTVEIVAPDEVQQVLTSGSVNITSATLSAVALQDLATQLATQSFAIQISKLTISAAATQTLSEQMLTDMGALKTKLETALQPSVKPAVTVTAEDYTTAKADLASALAPNITPNITLDAADILNANDIIAALTPNIHPTLSLTELEKTTFIGTVEALKPGINTRLFAGVTEMSDYILAVETDVKPSIATTLYATIEEMQLFRGIVETSVKPTVSVALKLEETTDEQGNPVSSLPDIAGQFADAIDKQISDTSERFSQQGTDIAGYLALAAYNYSFPDVISRYADLIDFQIAANQERLGVQGGNMTSAIANGATTYVFPDVALTFVEAIEVQVRNNQDRFMRQGTNAMNLIVQGMNGFDFSFIATAMIAGVRAGMEQEAIKTALGDVGAGAMRTIRDGLENEAGNISWAGILTAAITESVLTELADSMEGQ